MNPPEFHKDTTYADAVGSFYGEYLTSFESEHGQVSARLFKGQDGFVTAYVAFKPGYDRGRATDAYGSRLSEWAQMHRYKGVRLVISGSTG